MTRGVSSGTLPHKLQWPLEMCYVGADADNARTGNVRAQRRGSLIVLKPKIMNFGIARSVAVTAIAGKL
jgi:hypothetical protein